jgi:hypothetical protein
MILPPFRRDPNARIIRALYGMIVAQARSAASACRTPSKAVSI